MTSKSKISAEFLQKIREATNLIDIVGEHVVLRKAGSNHTGLCPFHSERSPSFSVSEQKQLYHCYGCKKGGDLFSFVMEIHGLGFPEAVEELAERARIALPKEWSRGDDGGDPEAQKRRAAFQEKTALAHKLNRFAAAFFHQALGTQTHVSRYFSNRGVQGELLRAFYVGAAPASWDALASHLVSKKAPLDLAVELGLVRPSQKSGPGPGYFDLFRNRAMFPILDMRGRVAGFGGRALPLPSGAPDVGGESPKYLNSSESLTFQKGKLLYGLYQAQKHIREKDEAILVEGYFDVLALHAAGFHNAIATCGTALTPDHLQMLRRLCGRITVLFDGDKAGISATERAMETGLDFGMVLHGAAMPEGLDPDEVLFEQDTGQLIPGGPEKMATILGAAKPLLDARIDEQIRLAMEGPEAKAQAIRKVAGWLRRFRDPVGREVRQEAFQRQVNVNRQLLERAMSEAGGDFVRQAPSPEPPPANRRRPAAPRPGSPHVLSQREKILLGAFIRGGELGRLLDEVGSNLPPKMTFCDLFDYLPARQWVSSLLADPAALKALRDDPQQLITDQLDPQIRSVATESIVSSHPPFEQEDLRLAIGRCSGRAWARFSQQIKAALTDAEARKDAGLQAALMKEYLDVQRKMKEFSSFYDEA